MKKLILIILIINFIGISSHSQTHQLNQQKYWIYRDRLQNEFMYYDYFNLYAAGCHLPATKRNNSSKIMGWHDGTIYLANYIQVLATEYALLKYYGLSTKTTEWDLFRAIETLFRLDMNGEKYFRNPEEYIEGDINGFFIRDDADNNFFNNYWYYINGTYRDWTVDSDLMKHINFENGIDCGESDCEHWMEMSKDQCWHLYLGLALVSKLLDGVEICNGDECYNFAERVRGLTHNIQYQLSGGNHHKWEIYNPADGHEVSEARGGKVRLYSYGFGIAGSEIVGYDLHAHHSVSDFWFSTFLLTWTWENWDADDFGARALATVGNVRIKDDFSMLYEEYREKTVFSYPHFPLIHMLLYPNLYGDEEAVLNSSILKGIKDCLDEAPLEGPNYNAPYFWTSPNMVVWPEKRGKGIPGDEFNGLDYMLLHNLYYLTRKELVNIENQEFPFLNRFNYYGNHEYPLFLTGEGINYDKELGDSVNVGFISDDNVTLKAGFHAKLGASFSASIDPYSFNTSSKKTKLNKVRKELLDQVIDMPEKPIDTIQKELKKAKTERYIKKEHSDESVDYATNTKKMSIEVFPNPTEGEITLYVESSKPYIEYLGNVYSYLGQLLLSFEGVANSEKNINLSDYPKGQYLIKIQIDDKILTQIVILQ